MTFIKKKKEKKNNAQYSHMAAINSPLNYPPMTVTTKEHCAVFPLPSVAVYVTVVFPTENGVPLAKSEA